ncbi:MAG TPA: hypothetical protein VHB99_02350 [Pirellulales bacterium]|nr:hypothetical protein [Pirellulales bacterium]
MHLNPYASSTEQPKQATQRTPLMFVQPFVLGAFLMCATLPYANLEGHFHADYQTAMKFLLAESATTAILGIAAFSAMHGKLGRAVCVSQLVVAGTMIPMLVHTRWYARFTYILPTLLAFACVNLLLLHFALRRFERSSWRAHENLAAIIFVDVGIILAEYLRPSLTWFKLENLLRELCLDFGQGTVCLLLWLRVRDVRREWRLEQRQETEDCDSTIPL